MVVKERIGEMDKNKRFAELAGVDEYWTTERMVHPPIPDYKADPREVLKVMIAREDYFVFYSECLHDADIIELILDTTGKLRDAAIEWFEKQKEENNESIQD